MRARSSSRTVKPVRKVLALSLSLVSCSALAQMPGGTGATGPSRAITLPLSGQNGQAGAVQSQQSSAAGGSQTSTISSSVQVSGNFSGSTPGDSIPSGPISLSLKDAVTRGLKFNLGSITAANSSAETRAARLQALSALLPSISLSASETVTQVNLAAYGFKFNLPPGLNFSIPTVVGPYSYSQMQGSLSQSVFDLVQRRNYKGSKENEQSSVLAAKDAREMVVMAAAGSYLQTLALSARVASQEAQVANAEALYNQASIRKQAGTNARIDVTRSLVELQTQKQRLSSLKADLHKQKITLARIIGFPLDREIDLVDPFTAEQIALPDPARAIDQAWSNRSDLKATEAQVRAAELSLSAAHAERYPSVYLNGDYGVIGPNPANTHGVFAVTGGVNVPVWDGGRIRSDIQQAEAILRQRRAELADQRGRVESDVRNALIELDTAMGQLRLARSNRDYANETLTQARDRFAAGVATTVEVVQAQEQVAAAEADYVSSLFSFNLAKLALARATGQAEAELPNLLKGNRP